MPLAADDLAALADAALDAAAGCQAAEFRVERIRSQTVRQVVGRERHQPTGVGWRRGRPAET